MKRYDKIKNIKKVNLLIENIYLTNKKPIKENSTITLNEEITIVKSDLKGYNVMYLKTETLDEANILRELKDTILKKNNAKFDFNKKVWFWFYNEKNEQIVLNTIKKTIEEINLAKKVVSDVDKLITLIDKEKPSEAKDSEVTKEEEEKVKAKLQSFKTMLLNIDNDEDFKETMKKIIDLHAIRGGGYSFVNTLLVFIQNPKAKKVHGKIDWFDKFNRNVKPDAKPILIWAPTGKTIGKPKEKIEQEKEEFFKKIKKTQKDTLTPKEKFDLDKITKKKVIASSFKLVKVYDVSDTVQIEGKEDYIKSAESVKDTIKWFEDNMISEEVRPIYQALLDFCEENNIKTELVDDLGGSRGVSTSGLIKILKNEGNDVGLTKTLAHEITHELLHQTYQQKKGGKLSYLFVGRDSRETVEQQAELSAWMLMYAFGFDLKTTSLNYTLLWGGNKENMIEVFDTVTKVVNVLIIYINRKTKMLTESPKLTAKLFKPIDVAELLGVEDEYEELTKNT